MGQADSFHGLLPVNRKPDSQHPARTIIRDHAPELQVDPPRAELMVRAQILVRLAIRDRVFSFSPKFPWLSPALHANAFCWSGMSVDEAWAAQDQWKTVYNGRIHMCPLEMVITWGQDRIWGEGSGVWITGCKTDTNFSRRSGSRWTQIRSTSKRADLIGIIILTHSIIWHSFSQLRCNWISAHVYPVK